MDNGTCIMFVLFYVFRHYKRVGLSMKRTDMVSDLEKCHLILKRMENNIDPDVSIDVVNSLIDRINSYGANMKLQQPLRYADSYDFEIVMIMSKLIEEIICYMRHPFYRKYSSEIFTRFLVLHNLPRVLLDDSSGDMSTVQNFHISKNEVLECVSTYLGNEKNDFLRKK